ncbi:hypothetical protein, partial [Escherichia coli]|uniref:hypothetical protein n=1 Tax=Escherichia coli TaxID=562 RepID=UPI0025406DBB
EYFPSTDSENETYTNIKTKKKKKTYCKNNKFSDEFDDDYFFTRNSSSSRYKTLDDGIIEDYQNRLLEYEKCNPEIATDNDEVFH